MHDKNEGSSQFAGEAGPRLTSAKTSPGAVKIFISLAPSDIRVALGRLVSTGGDNSFMVIPVLSGQQSAKRRDQSQGVRGAVSRSPNPLKSGTDLNIIRSGVEMGTWQSDNSGFLIRPGLW
jgi:hypothetical protein